MKGMAGSAQPREPEVCRNPKGACATTQDKPSVFIGATMRISVGNRMTYYPISLSASRHPTVEVLAVQPFRSDQRSLAVSRSAK